MATYQSSHTGAEIDAAVAFGKSPDTAPVQGSTKGITSGAVYTALQNVQPVITMDDTVTQNSSNPVKSSGIYTALQGKQNALTFDSTPTDGSSNPVTSDGIYDALAAKQDTLTFDEWPTMGSHNPVESNGVYFALTLKQAQLVWDEHPVDGSSNPVKSGGIYDVTADKLCTESIVPDEPNLTVGNAYSAGGLFYHNKELYVATVSMSVGTAITEGTNCLRIRSSNFLKPLMGMSGVGITARGASSTNQVNLTYSGDYLVFVDAPYTENSVDHDQYGLYFVALLSNGTGRVYPLSVGSEAPTITPLSSGIGINVTIAGSSGGLGSLGVCYWLRLSSFSFNPTYLPPLTPVNPGPSDPTE